MQLLPYIVAILIYSQWVDSRIDIDAVSSNLKSNDNKVD